MCPFLDFCFLFFLAFPHSSLTGFNLYPDVAPLSALQLIPRVVQNEHTMADQALSGQLCPKATNREGPLGNIYVIVTRCPSGFIEPLI